MDGLALSGTDFLIGRQVCLSIRLTSRQGGLLLDGLVVEWFDLRSKGMHGRLMSNPGMSFAELHPYDHLEWQLRRFE